MAEDSDATDPVLQAQVAVLEQEIDQLRRRLADAPKRQRALEERLLETKGQLAQAVSPNEKLSYTPREARETISPLRDEVDKLTQPPSAYGVIVGPKVKQDLELRAVAGLTFREVKREGASIQISLEVDLGREPAAGAAQRLTILPPLGACSRDVSPHDGGVEHLNHVGRLAHRREGVEEGLEHARLAQAPKALPNGIPVPALGRQGAPSDVVNAEVMHRFEEPTGVAALGAAPRAAGAEQLQHRRPILLGHPRQHGRLLSNQPARCHRSTNLGIHSPHTRSNPSTPPSHVLGTEDRSTPIRITSSGVHPLCPVPRCGSGTTMGVRHGQRQQEAHW